MFPIGTCHVSLSTAGAAAAAADTSCLGIGLIPRPRVRGWLRLQRQMARCAGHGFGDVADENELIGARTA